MKQWYALYVFLYSYTSLIVLIVYLCIPLCHRHRLDPFQHHQIIRVNTVLDWFILLHTMLRHYVIETLSYIGKEVEGKLNKILEHKKCTFIQNSIFLGICICFGLKTFSSRTRGIVA